MIHAGGLADPIKPSLQAQAATGRPEGGDSTGDPAASEPTDLTRTWKPGYKHPSTLYGDPADKTKMCLLSGFANFHKKLFFKWWRDVE